MQHDLLKGVTDHTQRLSIITKDLFQVQCGPAAPAWGCAWGGGVGAIRDRENTHGRTSQTPQAGFQTTQ